MCVCGVPASPDRGEKGRLHFLPFPQEGTHTPLNLTPERATSRPGVSDRPTGSRRPTLSPGIGSGRPGMDGSRAVAFSAPGCSPQGSQASRPRPAPSPGEGGLALFRSPGPCCGGGGGGSILSGLHLASLTGAPPAAPGEERRDGGSLDRSGPGSWIGAREGKQGAIQICRRALRRFRRRLRLALRARAEGGSVPPFLSFTGPRAPTLPPPALRGGSPACICPRGRSGRRRAWPRLPQPALRLRPRAAASRRPGSLPPSFRVGPEADLGPPCSVDPSSPFPSPPALCSWLWGWARDVKPSVASARLAGAGHQKSNVLFPNYPLSVREQGRTGWELNVKYPLQAGSITPGTQQQAPTPLCQLQTTQTKKGLRDLLFFQGVGGGSSGQCSQTWCT